MQESILLSPPPVFFIKSISEQGYSLSTAISDLIDNSITAGATRVELLIDIKRTPIKLYIADNGSGMSSNDLTSNMRFPSADLDVQRSGIDLGRFGLGLKTASFSQSRNYTVISKTKDTTFEGRTWDVEYLKHTNDWSLIINSQNDLNTLLSEFSVVSNNFHEHSDNFKVSTLVVWANLYKLERLLKKDEINDELKNLRSHLGLVYHRYIQSNKLQIRLNNQLIESFEPFLHDISGVQTVSEHFWQTSNSYIKFQGIILPKRSAAEAMVPGSIWAPQGRTLEELQGIYVYRNERLINFGGWLRTIPKSIYLQFARIRIDITNINDHEFQLNVAKSSINIPFGLKRAMADMVTHVAAQAAKEYRERLVSKVIRPAGTSKGLSLFVKEIGASGPKLKINREFELFRLLGQKLSPDQDDILKALIVLVENKLNEIWKGDTNIADIVEELTESQKEKIIKVKGFYDGSDYTSDEIRALLLESFEKNKETELFINSIN